MQGFRTTALVGTAAYALHIAEVMEEMRVSPKSLSLRLGLFGGEPFSERVRRELEERLGIAATDNYGISEVMGSGVSGECEFKNGLHLSEDHFLVEVVDPQTLEPLLYGCEGELVITTLPEEGIPLIRYRTRDLTSLHPRPCPCGRTSMRMSKVMARTDDTLIIGGVNVFPSQIESILHDIEGVEPHYQIIVERHGSLDELTILVEVSRDVFSASLIWLAELEGRIKARVHAVVGITPRLKLVEPRTLERELDKQRRVIDRREL